jgi:AcrR family transcriptional regulator
MAPTRPQTDRRQAILEAAFVVFARHGYAQACMQDIADEAGVAKPTVYSYLSDKATLLTLTLRAAATASAAEYVAALEPLADPRAEVHAALDRVAHDLLRLYCGDRAQALRRLLHAEVSRAPDLVDVVRETGPHRLVDALADRFARLMLGGRLRHADPAHVAELFVALLTGAAEMRVRMGTRRLTDADLDEIAGAAVSTVLQVAGVTATTG